MEANTESNEPSHHRALSDIDVDMVTFALSNGEGGYYDPSDGTVFIIYLGEVVTDEDDPADPDERDWVPIRPDDSRAAYLDMADFAAAVTDPLLSDRLTRALDGRGAFRRFRQAISEEGEPLYDLWARFSDALAEARSIEWLADTDLCDETEAALAVKARVAAADRALREAARWHRATF